ncbi:hypothetical protein [Candidatus Regiella endosymbiont of Tuberolachnus salignus]|uniref:hypothetical protein n=1 Tax=Candidatus Regiella endosymbiont of Tuberolachnus salignus TaxID=3077956 RepID=UPI0030CFEBF9
MAQAVFDTLKFVKILTAKGIPVEQAEAFSDAVLESHAASDVATKRDLDDLRKDMDAGFEKTDAQIASVRKDMDVRFEQVDMRFEQVDKRFEQVDKRFEQVDKRFDKLESKFDRVQWFIVAAALGLIFKEQIARLLGI